MAIKYYTNSKGISTDVSTLNGVHLNNALAKKYREVFESQNKEEYNRRMDEVDVLEEELRKRFKAYIDKLEKEEHKTNG